MTSGMKQALLAIKGNGYALPDGAYDRFFLDHLDLLGHPDPVIRDELTYGIFDHWILNGKITEPALRRAAEILTGDNYLFHDMESGLVSSSVKRTFSLLIIASILACDRVADFLAPYDLSAIRVKIDRYIAREKVMTGYDRTYGWSDSTSHTADVLKELFASGKIPDDAKAGIADAVRALLEKQPGVFQNRDEERLCAVFYNGCVSPGSGFMKTHIGSILSIGEPAGQYEKFVLRTNILRYLQTVYFYALRYGDSEIETECRNLVFERMHF